MGCQDVMGGGSAGAWAFDANGNRLGFADGDMICTAPGFYPGGLSGPCPEGDWTCANFPQGRTLLLPLPPGGFWANQEPPDYLYVVPGDPDTYLGGKWYGEQGAINRKKLTELAPVPAAIVPDITAEQLGIITAPAPAAPAAVDLFSQYRVPIIAGLIVMVIGWVLLGGSSNVREKRYPNYSRARRL
jgi:hypothetical protein